MSNNTFQFIGNLVNDAEIKTTKSDLQILNFRLAVSDGYGEKKFTDYHISLINDDTTITPDQIKSAEETLEKAKKQKQQKQYSDLALYSH
jgi:hypothetical protein